MPLYSILNTVLLAVFSKVKFTVNYNLESLFACFFKSNKLKYLYNSDSELKKSLDLNVPLLKFISNKNYKGFKLIKS